MGYDSAASGAFCSNSQISTSFPQCHLEIRQKIDPEVQFIQNLTSLLAQFEHSGKERLEVDPVTLGVLHATLAQSAGNIRRVLDECLPAMPDGQPPP